MSRFERLREELAKIRGEAVQKEAANKAAQRVKVEVEEKKRKKEEAARQLIEHNWSLVKKEILDKLGEINANVLSGQAIVIDWRKQTVEHEHTSSEYIGTGIEPYDSEYTDVTYLYHETVEIAELLIPNVGSVFLFRTLDGYSNKKYCDGYHRERRESINIPSKNVKILHKEGNRVYPHTHRLNEFVTLLHETAEPDGCCSNCGSISIDLDKQFPEITEEIERAIPEELILLHQFALL